jgi:hypothetical protein
VAAAEQVQQATVVAAALAAAVLMAALVAAAVVAAAVVAAASRFAGGFTTARGRSSALAGSRSGTGRFARGGTAVATAVAAAFVAALLVAAAEQAAVQTAQQTAAALLPAAVFVAARITARSRAARRGGFATAGRRSSAGHFRRTAGRFATLVAATSGFARLATAVAAAVVQAQHAIQELETEALAAQANADYKRSKEHVPFHRATSPLLELRIACFLGRPGMSRPRRLCFAVGRRQQTEGRLATHARADLGVFGVASASEVKVGSEPAVHTV